MSTPQNGDTHLHGPVAVLSSGSASIVVQVPCPGVEVCPHRIDEAARMRKFEEDTGISCSSGAQEAYEYLLRSGVFERAHLALAHRRSLVWDWDIKKLKVISSQPELFYGYFLIAAGVFFFAAVAALLVWARPPVSRDTLGAGLFAIGFLGVVPFAEKYMVRPNRIAQRAAPLLEEFYAVPDSLVGSEPDCCNCAAQAL